MHSLTSCSTEVCCVELIGEPANCWLASSARSFKRPLLSIDLSVCCVVCLSEFSKCFSPAPAVDIILCGMSKWPSRKVSGSRPYDVSDDVMKSAILKISNDDIILMMISLEPVVRSTSCWSLEYWLSMVLRLRQHNIGYTADGFYRSDDPTNSVKALKEGG